MSTKQRTFHVEGEKITIRSRPKTHLGNFVGYGVDINGEHFNIFNELYREKAEDKAFVRWVQSRGEA